MNVGDTFGRLTVVELLPGLRVLATCACGTQRSVFRGNLRRGLTRSCGCLQRERARASHATHGLTGSPEYTAWESAKTRATNPHAKHWADYGGRGITMAAEWLTDFTAFYAHIGPKPSPELTLDRIDNERGYEPGNVRWSTRLEQRHNRRPLRRGWTRKPFEELTPDGQRRRARVEAELLAAAQ